MDWLMGFVNRYWIAFILIIIFNILERKFYSFFERKKTRVGIAITCVIVIVLYNYISIGYNLELVLVVILLSQLFRFKKTEIPK